MGGGESDPFVCGAADVGSVSSAGTGPADADVSPSVGEAGGVTSTLTTEAVASRPFESDAAFGALETCLRVLATMRGFP